MKAHPWSKKIDYWIGVCERLFAGVAAKMLKQWGKNGAWGGETREE